MLPATIARRPRPNWILINRLALKPARHLHGTVQRVLKGEDAVRQTGRELHESLA